MSALARALLLLAAQATWLALGAACAGALGGGGARLLAFGGGAGCLALAGVLPRPTRDAVARCAAGALLGVGAMPLLVAAGRSLAWTPPTVGRHVDALDLLAACSLAPLCEELLFRGQLLGALRGLGAAPALALSSLAFGLWHGAGLHALAAGVAGLLLGGLRLLGPGLAPCVGAHAGLNLAWLLLLSQGPALG